MTPQEPSPIARFTVDALEVLVYDDRGQAGKAAAQSVARAIHDRQQAAGKANVVFAAAPSQNEFLAGLVASKEIDWSRVVGFHMDEYLGLARRPPRLVPPLPSRASVSARRSRPRPAPPDPRRARRAPAADLPRIRGPAARRARRRRLRRDRRERPPGVQRPARGRLPRPGAGQGRPARPSLPGPAGQRRLLRPHRRRADARLHADRPGPARAPSRFRWSCPALARPKRCWPPFAGRSAKPAPHRPSADTPERGCTSIARRPGWSSSKRGRTSTELESDTHRACAVPGVSF